MYHIAFFTDYRPLLVEKLNSFLKNNLSDVWICEGQQESRLQSLDDLPTSRGYWYSQPWYIHGSRLNKCDTQNFPSIPVYTNPQYKTSFEKIDAALNWLSTYYSWSIFPWAGPKRFLSFGFLSRERSLHDQFINASFTPLNVGEKFNNAYPYNTLVSSYEVTTNFSQLIKAILFNGYYKTAWRLWDICKCDVTPPWLITDLLFDDDIFSVFSWEEAKYEFIQSLTLTIKPERPLGVYQPLDRKSFESMCRLSTQEPDTFIYVPQDTNLEKLKTLLIKTENNHSYSDLVYLQEILGVTKWFYGLDRDRVDYGNSIFVAQNNTKLQQFNGINEDDDYCLLASF
ncbi:MAG: hypothetical protein KME64_28140 [Scytonematopsis contorta HA4267-MV1]|jgi:hypothetical protein|nr:hypothetical protein [Scytonematopsis contorta HA4267-MV1]